MPKRYLASLMSLILMISLASCETGLKKYRTDFIGAFDTFCAVTAYAQNEEKFNEIGDYVYERAMRCHQYFDIYNNYEGVNNVKTINDNAGIKPVKVDKEIIDMLKFAVEMHELTEGKTNVMLGSVLKIWHNYREAAGKDVQNAKIPGMAELHAAAKHISIDNLIINEQDGTVFIKDKNARLDVGAIGKGYAVELIADELAQMGYGGILLDFGGNIKMIPGKNGGDDIEFKIRIKSVDAKGNDDAENSDIVAIKSGAIVTSGDYQRYYTVDGINYHHIIDPDTLMPSTANKAVTVYCEDSAFGDAVSTFLFIVDYETGAEFCREHNIDGYWVTSSLQKHMTNGLKRLVIN